MALVAVTKLDQRDKSVNVGIKGNQRDLADLASNICRVLSDPMCAGADVWIGDSDTQVRLIIKRWKKVYPITA